MRLKILALFSSFLLIVGGCDQISTYENDSKEVEDNPKPQNASLVNLTSGGELSADAPEAKDLQEFLGGKDEFSTADVKWESLRIVRMEVEGYESEVSAVIAPIKKTGQPLNYCAFKGGYE